MHVQIGKWGNSLGVRIPSALAKELGLHDGTELDLQQLEGSIVLRRVKTAAQYSLADLLARVTPENIHGETDWGDPQGKEEW